MTKRSARSSSRKRRFPRRVLLLLLMIAVPGVLILLATRFLLPGIVSSPTRRQMSTWATDRAHRSDLITDLSAPCPGAPFRLPSVGFVGFLYGDQTGPNSPLNPHTGIDIFGDGTPGTVPVYAAYDGYLTRLKDWASALIIRVPHDPLDPSRQIWLYYTHMANLTGDESYISADYPPGTSEKFVKQGTLLGYQGVYDGGPNSRSIWLHLHFSVVLSDSSGSFRNETRIENTLDPSPYFGFNVNAGKNPVIPVHCGS